MMNTFIYHIRFLLLCILPVDIESIICADSGPHQFQLNNFNFDEFEKTIDSITIEEYHIGRNCTVQFYKFDNHLSVWFGDACSLSYQLKDGEIYFNTNVSLDSNIILKIEFNEEIFNWKIFSNFFIIRSFV